MRLLQYYMLLLSFPILFGCNRSPIERVPISGQVLIDGRPLGSGTIEFVPEEGRPSSAAISADGHFELVSESIGRTKEIGAAPGKYRVQVASSKIIDDKTIQWNAPARYADFRTSGLEFKIDKPTKDLRIQLSSDEGAAATHGGSAGEDGRKSQSRSDTTSEAPKP